MWGVRRQRYHEHPDSWPRSVDVCVVGAGVAGLCCGLFLSEGGARVAVVDACPELIGRGGSARESGALHRGVVEHPYRLIAALGPVKCRELYAHSKRSQALLAERVATQTSGGVWVALDEREEEQLRLSQDALSRVDVAASLLSPEEVRKQLGLRHCGSGLRIEDDGLLDPVAALEALASSAEGLGATMIANFEVTGIEEDGQGLHIRDGRGREIRSEVVVIAAGALSGTICPWLEDKIVPVREQALRTSPLGVNVRGAARLGYGYTNLRQLPDGGVMVSGCRWATPHMEQGERDDSVLVRPIQQRLEESLRRFFPFSAPEVVDRWAWLYAGTCDMLPIVGPLPGNPRLIVCTGFVGNPFSLAPAAAQAVAQGLLFEKENDLPSIMSALRFV